MSKTRITSESGIPESFQAKLFDLTGPKHGGSKGYLLFFVNENGDIETLTKVENSAMNLALYRAVQIFLKKEDFSYSHNIEEDQ